MFSKVIDKAKERVQSLLTSRDGPLLELVYFGGHRLLAFGTANDSPHCKLSFVELTLGQLELESIRLGNLADLVDIVDVRLEVMTTRTDIIHQRGTEMLSGTPTFELSKLSCNIALHMSRCGRWPERHPSPLVQTRGSTNY